MTTTLGTGVGPLYRLDGPLPLPRRYTLLQVAQEVPTDQGEDRHWLDGAWLQVYPQDPVGAADPCDIGTFAVKDDGGPWSLPKFSAFTANMAVTCYAAQVGPDPEAWFLPHLRPAFTVREAMTAEAVLATGGGLEIFGNPQPYLCDGNLDELNGGAAVSPLDGLERLEDAIGATGRGGVIHATPATVTAWAQYGNLLEHDTSQQLLRTIASGTPIVVGDGYIGVHPDDKGTPGAREAWAFATGMVRYLCDPPLGQDPIIIPGQYRQALNTSDNVVTYRAERNYLITFDSDTTSGVNPPLQAGVLIDRSIATP